MSRSVQGGVSILSINPLGTLCYFCHFSSARMVQGSLTSCLFHLMVLVQACVTWADAHSLCLNLTVLSQSGPGQPWCQAQGSLDGNPFLQYDSDCNKVRPQGFLGEKVKATRAWTEVPQMLGEMGQELRMILPDIKLETRTRGPLTLQAKLCCQQEAGQYTGASWEFSFNGQPALLLDTMHKKWTVIDPAASGTKEDWEKNKELAEYFRKTSMGDCNHWLGEFLELMEKVREPTDTPQPSTPWSAGLITCIVIVITTLIVAGIICFRQNVKRRSGTMKERVRFLSSEPHSTAGLGPLCFCAEAGTGSTTGP
ncbi:retinoic acid early transcript 1E [Saccopteryx leptura]|uniref:retinoic acid early transcript 1E n=1 Tax=Saccopteryx leptura TaxID=249018 RepID=UPI00339D1381